MGDGRVTARLYAALGRPQLVVALTLTLLLLPGACGDPGEHPWGR